MAIIDFDWDASAQLYQSPAPGDLRGNFESVADDDVEGPLGLLVQYIAAQPDDWRPYLSLAFDGEILDQAAIEALAKSDSFKRWQASHKG